MAAPITTYTGLQTAFLAWLPREGNTDLTARFDDFLVLTEARMYLGKEAMATLMLPAHEASRGAGRRL